MVVRAADQPLPGPRATAYRSRSRLASMVGELARFSRRNTLGAIGGFVGLLIIVVGIYQSLRYKVRILRLLPGSWT